MVAEMGLLAKIAAKNGFGRFGNNTPPDTIDFGKSKQVEQVRQWHACIRRNGWHGTANPWNRV